jgi:hypothetical protein
VARLKRRPRLAKWLVVVGTVLLLLGGIGLYLDRAVFSSGSFADRAAGTLQDESVRAVISEKVSDEVVKARPDLVGVRPIIGAVADGIVRSPAFGSLFRAGVFDLHRSVFDSNRQSVALAVNDVGVLVIQAVQRFQPSAAKRIPAGLEAQLLRISDGTEGFVADSLRLAETVRSLTVIFLALALLCLTAGVLFAPDRRIAFRWVGVGGLASGLTAVVIYEVARLLLTGRAEDEQGQAAARSVWDAFLGGMRGWALAVAAIGGVTAAASTSLVRPVELGPAARETWEKLSATPERRWVRVVRAFALIAAGGLVVAARDAVLRIAVVMAGIALIYVGVAELMRLLAPPPGTPSEHPHVVPPSRRHLPSRALAGAFVLLALMAGFFVARSSGEPEEEQEVTTCNGHRELCNRRLDDVAFAASHNSMSAATERGWLFAGQEDGIQEQLEGGVRSLLIDTHYGVQTKKGVATELQKGSKSRAKIADEAGPEFVATAKRLRRHIGYQGGGKPEVFLCHAYCEVGATDFEKALTWIRDFVVENPGEVLILSIEDDVTPEDTAKAFRSSGLLDYVYKGPLGPRPPTLRRLIDEGTPVVVMAENKTDPEYPWYHQQFGYVQETPFDFKTPRSMLPPRSCRPERGRGNNPMFLLNNWVETAPAPKPSNAAIVNSRRRLLNRAEVCGRRRGLKPNLVAVDFYATGDLLGTVDELNGIR